MTDNLKRLQDTEDVRWQFQALAVMDGVIKEVENPRQVILLLHGFNERGRRIFRRLLPYLPSDATIIAPNGPFPLPRQKEDRLDFGYAWYFFDKHQQKYLINQDLPKSWLKGLLQQKGLDSIPLTIIGFSQGGYLAPLLGYDLPQTEVVIGIGCEFRPHLVTSNPNFKLIAIHGGKDEIIAPQSALNDIEKLREKGIHCAWNLLPDTGHEINSQVGIVIQEILEQHGKRSL